MGTLNRDENQSNESRLINHSSVLPPFTTPHPSLSISMVSFVKHISEDSAALSSFDTAARGCESH